MLTDVKARKAGATNKAYKLFDGGGLFLYVTPKGAKLWRMKYRYRGKEKLLSFGPYPEVSLAEARQKRDEARSMLRAGQDPALGLVRTGEPSEASFEAVARQWWERTKVRWRPDHANRVWNSLKTEVFPVIGPLPIKIITPTQALDVIRRIEARGALDVAQRIRQRMSAVFVFGIASGLADNDPAGIIKGAIVKPKAIPQPAITSLEGVRQVLRDVEAIKAQDMTKLAMRFLALTVVRSNELRGTRWREFKRLDWLPGSDAGALETCPWPHWIIPAERMKGGQRAHVVPLSRQAIETLQALHEINGRWDYVFPNLRSTLKPMSENALGYLLNRAGYHHRHVPHGWRASFSTIMNTRFHHEQQVIDAILSHVNKNAVEAVYNRAAHLERRRYLLQEWADMLLQGFPSAASLIFR